MALKPEKIRTKKSAPPQFDPETLRAMAGERAFEHGAAYHAEGRVRILLADTSRVKARVEGSETYTTTVALNGREISGECSCPVFEDRQEFCKHMVAAALAASAAGPGGLDEALGQHDRIRAHLRGRPHAELIDRIMRYAERDEAIFEDLAFAAEIAGGDSKALGQRLKSALAAALRTRGFVDYRAARGWAQGVYAVLDRIEILAAQGGAAAAMEVIEDGFARLQSAAGEIDDSDGHISDLLARAIEIDAGAANAARPDPKRLARALFEREVGAESDAFADARDLYAEALGRAGRAEYRRLAQAAWADIKPARAGARGPRDYPADTRRFRLKSMLEAFAEEDGDVDAAIAIRSKDISSAYNYFVLAEYCRDHDRATEALAWAEEGVWTFEDDPDERLTRCAAALLRDAGRAGDADALLWRSFEQRPALATYALIKAGTGKDRRAGAVVRGRAIGVIGAAIAKPPRERTPAWGGAESLLVEILMAEKLFAEAWAAVAAHGCRKSLIRTLAEASEDAHPAQALAAYADRVEELARAGGQPNYLEAHRLLARMAAIGKTTNETGRHAGYVAELKTRYKAKRNFTALFEQAPSGERAAKSVRGRRRSAA